MRLLAAVPVALVAEPVVLVELLDWLAVGPAEPVAVLARLAAVLAVPVAVLVRLLGQNHQRLVELLGQNHRPLHLILESQVGFQQLVGLLGQLPVEPAEPVLLAGFVGQLVGPVDPEQSLERLEPNLQVVGLVQHFVILDRPEPLPVVQPALQLLRFRRVTRPLVRCRVVPRDERLGPRLGRLRIHLLLILVVAPAPAQKLRFPVWLLR